VGKLSTQRSYSRFGELSEETASYQDKTLFHSSYVRDKAGRITQKIETNQGFTRTTDYTYDTVGRLIEVKLDGVVTESYSEST
jgi:YD repeat-containing protein